MDVLRLALVLTVVALFAGLAIGITYSRTEEQIAVQEEKARQEALAAVFPEGATIAELSGDDVLPTPYWAGILDGDTVGYAFMDSARGYANYIKVVVGVKPDGTIIGLTVLSQEETPGLGSRVLETTSAYYVWNGLFSKREKVLPWFTSQFVGLGIQEPIGIEKGTEWHRMNDKEREALEEKNQITALAGATISTKAVVEGVRRHIPRYVSQLSRTQEAE